MRTDLSSLAEQVRGIAEEVLDDVLDQGLRFGKKARRFSKEASGEASRAAKKFEKYAEKNPIPVAVGALAAGLVLGWLLFGERD
jgi:ElaB/YqjD/DUF883 family membrane-anchored ribosome-binding protein